MLGLKREEGSREGWVLSASERGSRQMKGDLKKNSNRKSKVNQVLRKDKESFKLKEGR